MFTLDLATPIFPETEVADGVQAFTARADFLSVEDKLALISYNYKFLPAIPTATREGDRFSILPSASRKLGWLRVARLRSVQRAVLRQMASGCPRPWRCRSWTCFASWDGTMRAASVHRPAPPFA
jgi:hypothetical protein